MLVMVKILFGTFWLVFVKPFCQSDQIMEKITSEHYPVERHSVLTKDGYILSVYRIPIMNKPPNNKKVILFNHGMTVSGMIFVFYGRNHSAAFEFADAGYDVWIMNTRGTQYSKRHKTMSPTEPKFWDFSQHEIGIYDTSATIDYILYHTSQTKLSYVGHSQGGTALCAMLSDSPEYNDKIRVAHLMGPAVAFKYTHPLFSIPLRIMKMDSLNTIAKGFKKSGLFEIKLPTAMESKNALGNFCMHQIGRKLCRSFIFMMFGFSTHYYDELFQKLLDHVPESVSFGQPIHYAQIIAARKFQHYHHGPEMNMKVYGTPEPPPYNLSNVRTNIHILYGTTDIIIPPPDIFHLVNLFGRYPIAISKFTNYNHADFGMFINLFYYTQNILFVLRD